MKKIMIALCIGFFSLLLINSEFKATEVALANEVIRFHVLANSDSKADQNLKLKVRDRIINETAGLFDSNGNINRARDTLKSNIPQIQNIAKNEILKNGYDYDVKVSLGKSDFPTKSYGDLVLPKGSYEALKVEIGKAEGHNWWCVLFPPLCFVEESCVSGDSDAVKKISENLGESRGEMIVADKSQRIKLKFRAYEIWQDGRRRLASVVKKITA